MLEHLLSLLPPPAAPIETGDADGWRRVEESLGTGLPPDYKAFIAHYGTGAINRFLWVLNPFAANPHLNMLNEIEANRSAHLTMRQEYPHIFTDPFFPEAGGLLPWGITDNGDILFWLAEAEPERWPTVVYESRYAERYAYDEPMVGFLYRLLSRELDCPAFPGFPETSPRFLRLDEVRY